MTQEFKQYTINIGIIIKNILVKLHYSISIVKYYYEFL